MLTQMNSITMYKCTEMYSEPEIQNLVDLKPEPERSSWRRDEKVNVDSEASIVRKDYVEPFSVKMNLKVSFAFFMLKQSLILSSVVVFIYICGVCDEDERVSTGNGIIFISKL